MPTITTAGTLTSFTTTVNTPSAAQSFTVTGTNLTENISVSAPLGFEVSTDNQVSYASSNNITQTLGVASNTVYVRIASMPSAGNVSGNISLASTNATTRTVAVSGTIETGGSAPVITATNISGTVGVALTTNITASGVPTSYAISTGTLPGGLTLNTTSGAITGTPTESVTNRIVSVTASNSVGTGSPGDLTFNIAKGAQTITNFSGLRDLIVGGTPLTLTAGTASGLTVTYASSNSAVASVSNNIVTAVAPGITTIVASQAGDANWNAATDVFQGVKVTAAPLVAWDFNSESSPATSTADVFDSNLDSSAVMARGAGAAASSGSNSFRTQGFQNNGISLANTDYFEFQVSAKGGYTLSLSSIDARFIGTDTFYAGAGVTMQFAYSTDGSNFTLIEAPIALTAAASIPAVDLSRITALQNLSASTTVTFRYYASGQTGTGGWGFSSPVAGQYGLSVGGTLQALPPGTPLITSSGNLTGLNYTGTGPSTAQSVTLSVTDLTSAPGNLTVTGSSNFEVSTTDANTGFGSSATLAYTDAYTLTSNSIWVRLKAGLANGNYGPEIISVDGGGASGTFTASGTATVPNLTLSTTNLGTFITTNGTASASRPFTVTGANLQGNVSVTPPAGFEIATNTNSFVGSLTLTPTSGSLATTTVNVRLAASNALGTIATNNIVVSSSGATDKTVSVAGQVVTGTFTLSLSATTINEGDPAATLTATLDAPAPAGGLTINLTTSDTDNSEVTLSSSTLTVEEGLTTGSVSITPKADGVFDLAQIITITGAAANWASAGTVAVTVANIDPAPVSYISLTTTNSNSYTQNFDGLGVTTISNAFSPVKGTVTSFGTIVSSSLDGWFGAKESGTGTALLHLVAEGGTSSSGGIYNYGNGTGSDRALGTVASGTSIMTFGALIKNDTGTNLNSLRLSLKGEFWRGAAPSTTNGTVASNALTFAFGKVDGTSVTPANFLTTTNNSKRTGLDVTCTITNTNTALDGNAASNQVSITGVAIPISLAPGEVGFIRWTDKNDDGNDAGIAIDDFSLTGSTEALTFDGEGTAMLANVTTNSPYALSGIWPRGGSSQVVSATIRPDFDTSTLTAVSVTVPAAFGTPTTNNVTPAGGAAGGTVSVEGQVVTVTGTSITKVNPGVINIGGLSTPDTATVGTGDGIYSFAVSTAGVGGSLAPILVSPNANVLIPIANLRDVDANFVPLDLGKRVAVEGVVTWSTIGGTYLQADGVGIGALGVLNVNPLVPGNKYAILGTVQQSSGLTRLSPATLATDVVNLGADTLPTPLTITLGKTAAEMEALEGVLIKVENLNRAASSTNAWGAATTIASVDGSNNPIDIRIQTDSTATTEPGYPVTVTGVLGQFDTANPRDSGYQIMPRTMADLSFPPTLRLAWTGPAVVNEDGSGYDPTLGFLTLTRLGTDTSGTLAVNLSVSPAGRVALSGATLPQTVNFAAGEVTKTLEVSPVNDTVYTGNSAVSLTASSGGFTSSTISPFTIVEDDPQGSTFAGAYPGRSLTEVAPNGLTYLVNYAFGGTSTNAAVLPTQDNSDPTKLTLIAVVRTDDSSLAVAGEASTGLTSGWSSSGVTTTNSTNQASLPANTVRKVVSVDRGADEKKFLRIKVTK